MIPEHSLKILNYFDPITSKNRLLKTCKALFWDTRYNPPWLRSFNDICSTIKTIIKGKVTIFHWFFQANSIFRETSLKKFFNNFIFFVINHGFYFLVLFLFWFWFLSLFQCINNSSSVSLEKAKIIIIVN